MPGGLGMRALRNTILILVVRVISRIIALVAVIIIGNYLDPTRFGEMQTAITYVGLVGTLTDLGFSALYVREGARHTDQIARYWNNVASLKVIGAADRPAADLRQRCISPACVRCSGRRFAILVLSGYQLLLRNTLYAMQRLTFEIIEIVPETLVVFALVVIGVHIHADTGFFLWAYAIQLRVRLRVLRRPCSSSWGCSGPGSPFEPGLLLLVGARRGAARHHLHHHDRLFQGGRADPAAVPAVQRGRVLHVRVQAVRVAALHPVCLAQRRLPGALGVPPALARRACCRSPRSSSRRW